MSKQKPNGYWNDYDRCYNEAKKYSTITEFAEGSSGAHYRAGGNSWVDVLVSHSGNLKNSTICGTRNSNVSYINVGTQINITNGASEAANYYVSILVFGGTIA